MDASKEEFLREFGEHYGYPNGPKSIDQIRATEFKRLDGPLLFKSLQDYTFLLWLFPQEKFQSFNSVRLVLSWVHFDGQSLFWLLMLLDLAHLGIVGSVYLDHAGATLYSELQLEAIFKDLNANVFGNPRILFHVK